MVLDTSTPSKTPVSVDPIQVCSVRPSGLPFGFSLILEIVSREKQELSKLEQARRNTAVAVLAVRKVILLNPDALIFVLFNLRAALWLLTETCSHVVTSSTLVFDHDVLTAGQEFELFDQETRWIGESQSTIEIFNLDRRKSQLVSFWLICLLVPNRPDLAMSLRASYLWI